MSKGIVLFLIITIYVAAVMILESLQLTFFSFFTGSVGLFTICIKYFLPHIDNVINIVNEEILIYLSSIFKYFQVFKNYSTVVINTKEGIVSMIINYECSGAIELMVFIALALFFPFGGKLSKVISITFGVIYIFISNIIRLLFIIFITFYFGENSFYLAHTLFARILFFILMVLLYYTVFSKVHLRYQKVGES